MTASFLEIFDPSAQMQRDGGERQKLQNEAVRNAAFEAGYSSGWEDAEKASLDQRQRIDSELERSIQDLGFTFHEASNQLRLELAALVDALLNGFFSKLLPDALRSTVRSEILRLGESHMDPNFELVANSATAAIFETLGADIQTKVSLVVEPTVANNQAFIRLEEKEICIDFAPLLDTVQEQLAALSDPDNLRVTHD